MQNHFHKRKKGIQLTRYSDTVDKEDKDYNWLDGIRCKNCASDTVIPSAPPLVSRYQMVSMFAKTNSDTPKGELLQVDTDTGIRVSHSSEDFPKEKFLQIRSSFTFRGNHTDFSLLDLRKKRKKAVQMEDLLRLIRCLRTLETN